MPPASLSALEVISPGPTTARNRAMRLRQKAERRLRFVPRFFHAASASVTVAQAFIDSYVRLLDFGVHSMHYVVHRDCANWMFVLVDNRETAQIIFIEKLEDFFVLRIGSDGKQRLGDRVLHALGC